MRCFMLFYAICLVTSISFSYHIRSPGSENTIPSSNEVMITTSTTEMTSLKTEILSAFSTQDTTTSSFTETSYEFYYNTFENSTSSTLDSRTEDSSEVLAITELTKGTRVGDDLNLCPAKNSNYTILLPHPDDCSKFYICDSGSAHLKVCPFGLHFNRKINACDYRGNAGCDKEMVFLSSVILPTSTGNELSLESTTEKMRSKEKDFETENTNKFSWTTLSANFNTSVNSSSFTDTSKMLENNSTTEPTLIITTYSEETSKSSTSDSETSSASSGSTISSRNNATHTMNFTPDIMKLGEHKSAYNTIEPETYEPQAPKCGQRFTRIPRVVGGVTALAGEFPWMVSVRVLTSHYCGGVIINKDWILTAGHCVRRFAARYWRIRLGGHDVNIDQFRPQWDIPVSKVILHPKFGSPARYSYDMALMKLQRSIKFTDFAAPICLPENLEEAYDGVNATVIGWGRTNESVEATAPFLQKVIIPVINNTVCAEWYKRVHYGYIRVRNFQICAGFGEGGKDACKGDSGGPLVAEDKHNRYTLLGIASAGVGCGRSQLPGIYSRATYFVPWILKVTGGYTHWPLEEDYDY